MRVPTDRRARRPSRSCAPVRPRIPPARQAVPTGAAPPTDSPTCPRPAGAPATAPLCAATAAGTSPPRSARRADRDAPAARAACPAQHSGRRGTGSAASRFTAAICLRWQSHGRLCVDAYPRAEPGRRPAVPVLPRDVGGRGDARGRHRRGPRGDDRRHRCRLRRRHRRGGGADHRDRRGGGEVPLPRPAAEAAVHHQRRSRPPGAVRLAAAERRAAEQRGRPCGEGRRVRPHVAADAGQPRAGDGDAPTRRTLAEAVGRGAGRTPRHGRGAWLAGRRGGDAGDAVRHARHRRARDGGPASALRRSRDHRQPRSCAAADGVPGARLPAHRCTRAG